MSLDCVISIGGEDNYVVDEFDTTASDRCLTFNNSHSDGIVCIKLGANSGTSSKFQVKDSDGLDIFTVNAGGTMSASLSLNSLSNVDTTGIATGKILKYNGNDWAMSDQGGVATNYPDSIAVSFGNDDDLSIQHNSTNSVISNDTGDLQLINTENNKKIILKLGSTNANTIFEVQDSGGGVLFSVDGSGAITGTNAETVTYVTSLSTFPLPAKREESQFESGKPLFAYLDTAGRRLKFNKGQIYICESSNISVTLYLAIYKLTGSATFNDCSTYDNSTKVVMSSPVAWSNTSGTTSDGLGFVQFDFSTTSLDATGYYFLGMYNSSSGPKYLSYKDIGDTAKELQNLYYVCNTTRAIPANTMENTIDSGKKGDSCYCRLYYE